MENYDDVLQFVSKVGDDNLNYRSFQNSTVSSGNSKWHLLNEVANYKQQAEYRHERIVPLTQPAVSRKPEPAAVHSPFLTPQLNAYKEAACQGAPSVTSFMKAGSDKPTEAKNDFAHLFKKSHLPEAGQDTPVKTDSLSALFQRIGS